MPSILSPAMALALSKITTADFALGSRQIAGASTRQVPLPLAIALCAGCNFSQCIQRAADSGVACSVGGLATGTQTRAPSAQVGGRAKWATVRMPLFRVGKPCTFLPFGL
jgi:hypothetical protein